MNHALLIKRMALKSSLFKRWNSVCIKVLKQSLFSYFQRMLEAHGSKPTGSSASVTEKKSDSPKLAEDDVE